MFSLYPLYITSYGLILLELVPLDSQTSCTYPDQYPQGMIALAITVKLHLQILGLYLAIFLSMATVLPSFMDEIM